MASGTLDLVVVCALIVVALLAPPQPPMRARRGRTEPEWPGALCRWLLFHDDEHLQALARALAADRRDDAKVPALVAGMLEALGRGRSVEVEARGAALQHRLSAAGREREALAVHLLRNEALIQQAESFRSLPVGMQGEVLQAGLEACRWCANAAVRMGEDACAAAYLSRLGNGLATLEQPQNAALVFRQALALWEPLAAREPEAYLWRVGDGLTHLGNSLEAAGEPVAARRAFRKAVRVFRELRAIAPERACLGLAMALCDGATLRRRCGKPAAARKAFAEALVLLERASDPTGRRFIPFTRAQVLHNWVDCQWDAPSGRFHGSEDEVAYAIAQAAAILAAGAGAGTTPDRLDLWVRTQVLCANVLSRSGRPGEARAVLAQAEHGAARLESPLHAAEVLRARVAVEQMEKGVAAVDPRVDDRAIAALEHGLAALAPGEERLARRYKAEGEVLYALRLLRAVEDGDHDLAFRLLETLRRVECRAGVRERDGGSLDEARRWLARRGDTLLYVQVVPGGAVFFAVCPEAIVAERVDDTAWMRAFDGVFHEWNEIMYAAADTADLDLHATSLAAAGRRLFLQIPDPVRAVLQEPERQVFLSAYADLQNLPYELLRLDDGEWLGLRKIMPRIDGFHQLRQIRERHPATGSPRSAAVFADPASGLGGAIEITQWAGELLRAHGWSLFPGGADERATARRFREALECGVTLGLFCGHGGHDATRGSGFSKFAGNTRLWAVELGELALARHPILYVDCCQAGITSYAMGGRYLGLGTAALDAGASACLMSSRVVVDAYAADLCERILHGLVVEGRTVGDALLWARRATAEEGASPLAWAFPVLCGNPGAMLPDR
ncbi:MAG TPA: CHAT domain-containing protein [Longimicrobium sp.]|nr:CHAT domain-containing protein [Longimicrobium sp.]